MDDDFIIVLIGRFDKSGFGFSTLFDTENCCVRPGFMFLRV